MQIHYRLIFLMLLVLAIPITLPAQVKEEKQNYSAYELMSNFYNQDFHPYKKRNVYIGFAFSLEDKRQENVSGLLQNVIDGKKMNYNLLFRGGYYINDYFMLGANFNYLQDKFDGIVYRSPDTLQSNSITRLYEITPNIRTAIPLTHNERLSFFVEVGLTFGYGNTLVRNVRDLDLVDKSYSKNFHFRAGISPGITFFAIERFAFEVQLNVLGYDLMLRNFQENDGPEAREAEQKIDANIDLLSLQLGLAYYFGSKKK